MKENETMGPVVGDLWARSSDFPLADELADRLKRMVPPQALGAPDPEIRRLQMQLSQQHGVMTQLSAELKQAKDKQSATDLQKDIEVYDSETRRLAVVGKIDEPAVRLIVREMVSQMMGLPVNAAIGAHLMEQSQMEAAASQIPGSAAANAVPPPPNPNGAVQ